MDEWHYPDVIRENPNIPRTKEQEVWIEFLDLLAARLYPCSLGAHFKDRSVLLTIYRGSQGHLRLVDRRALWDHKDALALLEVIAPAINQAFESASAYAQDVAEAAGLLGESVISLAEATDQATQSTDELRRAMLEHNLKNNINNGVRINQRALDFSEDVEKKLLNQ